MQVVVAAATVILEEVRVVVDRGVAVPVEQQVLVQPQPMEPQIQAVVVAVVVMI